jgi:hypothetical protein
LAFKSIHIMKHLYLPAAWLLLYSNGPAIAQTTITASNTFPAVGYTDTFRVAAGSNVGPSGNGVTWDFSSMTAAVGGTFSVVTPSSTPYSSTFPSATHALQLNIASAPGPAFEYYRLDGSGWNILASTYSAASPGSNYTANEKLRIPFPFSLGNSRTDTFQKTGSGPDAYTITYDGFGTLMLPGRSYNNVVRMKYQWIGGEIAYNWFTTSPLFFVATWSQNGGGQFQFLGKNLPVPSGISETEPSGVRTVVFPNPAQGHMMLSIEGLPDFRNAECLIQDVSGRTVRVCPVTAALTAVSLEGLRAGHYTYRVQQAGARKSGGKIVVL